jgi:hypothetical protein
MLYENWSIPDTIFSTDACLTGCGVFYNGKYFHSDFPENISNQIFFIAVLELFGIILAFRLGQVNLKVKG